MRTAKYVNIKIRIGSIFKYAALLCFLNQYSEAKINPIKKLIAANIGLIVSCHGRNHEIISSKKVLANRYNEKNLWDKDKYGLSKAVEL